MLSFSNGNLRLCGGKTKWQKAVNTCFLYNEQRKWSPTFSMIHARFSATVTTLWDGSLWAAGGISTESGFSAVRDSSEVLTDKGILHIQEYKKKNKIQNLRKIIKGVFKYYINRFS